MEPCRGPARRHLAAAGELRAFARRSSPRQSPAVSQNSAWTNNWAARYRERLAFLEFKEKALARPQIPDPAPALLSAPAARTTPPPACPRAAAPPPASAATSWRCGWTATLRPSPTWAAKARPGSARRRSPNTKHIFANLGDGTYYHSGLMAIRAAVRGQSQHDLQDPVQRRRGDDRRPAARRPARSGDDFAPDRRRGREPHRHRHRRAGKISRGHQLGAGCERAPPRRTRRRAARTARDSRAYRPSSTTRPAPRKTPPAQARRVSRSGQARRHQRNGVRGLRRLQRQIQLPVGGAAGDRVRPQAHHQPIHLQQGLFLRQGILPELRHRRGRHAEKGQGRHGEVSRRFPALPEPVPAAIDQAYGVLVTGIGGTGVVTIGQILAMAAHLEGKGVSVLDMSGLAQKAAR